MMPELANLSGNRTFSSPNNLKRELLEADSIFLLFITWRYFSSFPPLVSNFVHVYD